MTKALMNSWSIGMQLKDFRPCIFDSCLLRYCGSYMDHQTIFRVPSPVVHIQLQCSSKLSDKPLLVEYGSYNISQRKPGISSLENLKKLVKRRLILNNSKLGEFKGMKTALFLLLSITFLFL